MLIVFHELPEYKIKNMNGGDGSVSAKMYNDPIKSDYGESTPPNRVQYGYTSLRNE